MYWMLLPPSANVGRHLERELLPLSGSRGDLFYAGWEMVVHLLAPHREQARKDNFPAAHVEPSTTLEGRIEVRRTRPQNGALWLGPGTSFLG